MINCNDLLQQTGLILMYLKSWKPLFHTCPYIHRFQNLNDYLYQNPCFSWWYLIFLINKTTNHKICWSKITGYTIKSQKYPFPHTAQIYNLFINWLCLCKKDSKFRNYMPHVIPVFQQHNIYCEFSTHTHKVQIVIVDWETGFRCDYYRFFKVYMKSIVFLWFYFVNKIIIYNFIWLYLFFKHLERQQRSSSSSICTSKWNRKVTTYSLSYLEIVKDILKREKLFKSNHSLKYWIFKAISQTFSELYNIFHKNVLKDSYLFQIPENVI